ncbi:hypothetical protein TNCV_4081991 [Trichonephila clavipes]|nr:hypothetical protein TNCV_4081991 [Trichonephila clavipes]
MGRDILRHGPPGPRTSATMGASSSSHTSLNKVMIQIISTVKYTNITHSIDMRQSVKLVCVILSPADLFVSGYCLYEYLTKYDRLCSIPYPCSTKLKLDDRGHRRQGRLFQEGWEKKKNHSLKSDLIKRSPRQNGEGGRTPKLETLYRSRAPAGGCPCSDSHQTYFNCQVIYSQFGLAIHQNDHQARHRFVEWAQNEIAVVPDFHKRILFSDEAHFWLNGYVNKQNCRIWSEANPQVYVETPLHPEKLTV